MTEMPKAYDAEAVEPHWYQFWLDHGVFRASLAADDPREPYVIPMPPPNVTGSLHMGHALFGTIQDVLARHARMSGKNTLWQPGMDHAGIATQTVVERQLAREGQSRHDLASHVRCDTRRSVFCGQAARNTRHQLPRCGFFASDDRTVLRRRMEMAG